jgi:hypothetical protein
LEDRTPLPTPIEDVAPYTPLDMERLRRDAEAEAHRQSTNQKETNK